MARRNSSSSDDDGASTYPLLSLDSKGSPSRGDIVTPLLTTPVGAAKRKGAGIRLAVSSPKKPAKPSLMKQTEKPEKPAIIDEALLVQSTAESERETKRDRRLEAPLTLPVDRNVLTELGMAESQLLNRIVLKRVDGRGVVFIVPAPINEFLTFLFKKYRDKESKLMAEVDFQVMVSEGLLAGLFMRERI